MQQTTLMGYTVELTENDNAPYILHGKRGATIGLIRCQKDRTTMFPVNLKTMRVQGVNIKGNYWFSDKDGALVALS